MSSRCRRNGREVRAERANYLAMVWKEEAMSLVHSAQCVRERGEHPCPDSEPWGGSGWQSGSGSLWEDIQAQEEQGG